MWTYIVRRLLMMIPTLFGVTLVSFLVMQIAPGDPLLSQADSEGTAGDKSAAHDAYVLQKRDLKLDKPWLLNFNYFRDFSAPMRSAAFYRGHSFAEIERDLAAMAKQPDADETARLEFLRSLGIKGFDSALADPEQHRHLARTIQDFLQSYCENLGTNGVSALIGILHDEKSDLKLKIGAIRCLSLMVVDPFQYTYLRHPDESETPEVTSVWKTWWDRARPSFPPLTAARRATLIEMLPRMAASRDQLFDALDDLKRTDMPFFAELLLGDSPLATKAVCALVLKQFIPAPLRLDVPLDASPEMVKEASENWSMQYDQHRAEYEPGVVKKLWYIVGDTQYAYMVGRLVTFNFGKSALRTHEPVSERISSAFVVSAPLMVISELLTFFVAIPLGIICAVYRGRWGDKSISMGLFFLYSIPPFVAAMLFLLYFCFGDYLHLFPMGGLHSEGADKMSWGVYLIDYAWHAFLPVVCLSLFSLAALAMYGRSSMLDVINQDYVRTARAKGLAPHVVIFKHVLRNGLIPILTLASSLLPAMFGGSVLIEVLFNIPGLGRLGWDAIDQKDVPTLMALLYLEAIITLFSFLITDLLYVLVDPRISFSSRGKAA